MGLVLAVIVQCHRSKDALGRSQFNSTDFANRLDELIEVKHAKKWSEAIAQLQAYSRFYPNHRKRLHIFGLHSLKNPHAVLESAKNVCSTLDIVLTWEP